MAFDTLIATSLKMFAIHVILWDTMYLPIGHIYTGPPRLYTESILALQLPLEQRLNQKGEYTILILHRPLKQSPQLLPLLPQLLTQTRRQH